ncbi:Protein dml-1, partial [Termitomyces sp. T112]
GSSTYCPRLLVFDHKSNFGTLSKSNALVGADEDEISDVDPPTIWNGHVAEYKQDIIPKSAYHSSLDSPNDSGHADQSGDTEYPHKNVRYWSDFNRVYYVPKTIQRLPDPAEWENVEGDWNHGQSAFTQYDEDHAVTDGSLRSFFEECDSPQGLH